MFPTFVVNSLLLWSNFALLWVILLLLCTVLDTRSKGLSSLPNLISNGAITMSESERGMNRRQLSELTENYLNHSSCTLAYATFQQHFN